MISIPSTLREKENVLFLYNVYIVFSVTLVTTKRHYMARLVLFGTCHPKVASGASMGSDPVLAIELMYFCNYRNSTDCIQVVR